MDNLSHTLIGALIGEAMARSAPASKSALPADTRRNLLIGAMVVGSNFPDVDFVYSAVTGLKLDYLLHHRGHTHTVLGAIVSGLIVLTALLAWLKFRRLAPSPSDRAWLAGAALFAPLLHVAMDFNNSYGVHPFWPVYNGWLYGDSVFIVEPLFWAAAAPLAFTLRSVFTRSLVALALLAGIVLSLSTGFVPTPFVGILIAITALLLIAGRYSSARNATMAGLAAWIFTTLVFAISGRVAAQRIELAAQDSGFGEVLDHVLTPMPANPLCWEVILVQGDTQQYALRHATLSIAPAWLTANACPLRTPNQQLTAPLVPSQLRDSDSVLWRGELVLSRAELKQLAAAHCEVADLLRFARAPFFTAVDDTQIVGDLRYDREPELGFGEIAIGKDACPRFTPPWTPPRADLLRD